MHAYTHIRKLSGSLLEIRVQRRNESAKISIFYLAVREKEKIFAIRTHTCDIDLLRIYSMGMG